MIPEKTKKSLDTLEFDLKKIQAGVSYYDSIIQKPVSDEDKLEELKIRMKLCRDQILDSCLKLKEDLSEIKNQNKI